MRPILSERRLREPDCRGAAITVRNRPSQGVNLTALDIAVLPISRFRSRPHPFTKLTPRSTGSGRSSKFLFLGTGSVPGSHRAVSEAPCSLRFVLGSVGRALSIQRLERCRSHSRLYGISIVDRAWAGGGRRASGSVCESEAGVIGYTLPIAQSFGQVPMAKVAAPQDRDAQGAWACRGTKQVRRVCRGLHRATTSGGARESAAAVNRSMTTMAPPH